jgi:LemA protein
MSVRRWFVAGIAVLVFILGASAVSGYNALVSLDQAVAAQWGQVENVYQRRADLIPNLVETVKGAAAFEKEAYVAVAEARSRVGQVSAAAGTGGKIADDPQALQRFQQAQDGLSNALSRLMVVVERYPDLKATAAFRDLQAQLEGTENRIAVERMRFNEAAQSFNTRRQSFPTVIVAGLLGARFKEKAFFQAQAGADVAPKVKF